jgi:hypothetical protein
VTNTKLKFVVVFDDRDIRDAEIRQFFQRLHALVIDAVCNPFYQIDSKLSSPRFAAAVAALVAPFNSGANNGDSSSS